MSTAFEKIGADRQLQDHWIRRLVAAIIDGIIIGIVALAIQIFVGFNLLTFLLVLGILWFLYASFMESSLSSTVGKQVMNLKVTTVDGKMPTLDRAFIRNISKIIFWLLWPLDVIIGMATPGDPHQKYTDRIAGTTVLLPTPAATTPATV